MLTKNLIKCIKIFLEAADKPEKDSVYLETGLGKGDSVLQILNNLHDGYLTVYIRIVDF